MRTPISPLQLAIVIAFVGSLASVFIPEFVRNVHASRLSEPLEGLRHVSAQASMQAAGAPPLLAYPDSVARTPEQVPAGKAATDPEGTWSHATWTLLSFEKTGPHFFSFEFESERSETGAHFMARAFGDLDGDGELSNFEVFGDSRPGQEPRVYPVRIFREIE